MKYPIPKKDQKPAEFLKEQAETIVKNTLQTKLVEMFSKPEPVLTEVEGNDLYIMDTIYDVWPDDENRGKSAKLIAEIFQGKIRDYSRIYEEYEYKNAENQYENFGVMKFILHFIKTT